VSTLHARLRANRARKHSIDLERWQLGLCLVLLTVSAMLAGLAGWNYFEAMRYRDAGIIACHSERPPIGVYSEVTGLIEAHHRRLLRDVCPGSGIYLDTTPQPILYAHDGGIVAYEGGPEWAARP
jgi:hypothetical protein